MFNKKLILCMAGLLLSTTFSAHADDGSIKGLFHQPGDAVVGNPKGNVTIVEFFDYQCSHCVSMVPTIDAILKHNKNVRVVFKNYPIRGSMSDFAARAAIAANLQGKYHEFNTALLQSYEELTPENIFTVAETVGLNVNRLKQDMESNKVKDVERATIRLAEQLNVTGTPAFFIGKTNAPDGNDVAFVYGEMSQSDLQNEIDKDSH